MLSVFRTLFSKLVYATLLKLHPHPRLPIVDEETRGMVRISRSAKAMSWDSHLHLPEVTTSIFFLNFDFVELWCRVTDL